ITPQVPQRQEMPDLLQHALQVAHSTVVREAGAGALRGLFPVVYIIAAAFLLYNLTVATGHAGRLRSSIRAITGERSLHLLLIGFAFAAPQVLTAAVTAAGLAGHEGKLLRIGLRYSLGITVLLGLAGLILGMRA
ncbi:MAG: L-lactate permease, partial [Actinobacteria bacterium]|nr:L-lactate permease [Actinomycetota bacterium]